MKIVVKGKEYTISNKKFKESGITRSILYQRLSAGWSVEDALSHTYEINYTDIDGNFFKTIDELCTYYHLNRSVFIKKLHNGESIDLIIEDNRVIHEMLCYTGYSSLREYCKQFGDDCDKIYNTLYHTLQNCYCWDKSILDVDKNPECCLNTKKYADHKGNRFSSISEMCRYWGISRTKFNYRRQQGWSMEKALTYKVEHKSIEYNGKVYDSEYEICKEYGVPYDRFKARRNKGLSIEESLQSGKPAPIKDYTGKEFSSVAAMCEYHGISIHTYRHRYHKGWRGKKLFTPVASIIDPEGNEFQCINDMCRSHGVSYATYQLRRKAGMSMEQALYAGKYRNYTNVVND